MWTSACGRRICSSATGTRIACGTRVITLDKSQSGGQHEKTILSSDAAKDPAAYRSHFAIGQSATHQISHTKGGCLDGRVGFEGSTNWSASGEGTFVTKGTPGSAGYKAQNKHAGGLYGRGHDQPVHGRADRPTPHRGEPGRQPERLRRDKAGEPWVADVTCRCGVARGRIELPTRGFSVEPVRLTAIPR